MRYPFILLVGLGLAGPAQALRCGSDIVSPGDSTFALQRRCGPPTAVEHLPDRVVADGPYDPLLNRYAREYIIPGHDLWYYNFGPSRFVARITIRDGKVIRIDDEGYGY